jgi:hypothetical protein
MPPLPVDVVEVMKQTTELFDLVYWKPSIEPGSDAENIELSRPTSQERDGEDSEETGRGVTQQSAGMTHSDWARTFEESDLETRVKMGLDFFCSSASLVTLLCFAALTNPFTNPDRTKLTPEDEELLEALHSGKLRIP